MAFYCISGQRPDYFNRVMTPVHIIVPWARLQCADQGDVIIPGSRTTVDQGDVIIPGSRTTADQGDVIIPGSRITADQGDVIIPGSRTTADQSDVIIPGSRITRFGQLTFCSSAPTVWNDLPSELKKNSDINQYTVLQIRRGILIMPTHNRRCCELCLRGAFKIYKLTG